MHPPDSAATAIGGTRGAVSEPSAPGDRAEPPRRSARVRAAVSGTVVLVLIGFGAAVIAAIITPGGERVAVGQSAAAESALGAEAGGRAPAGDPGGDGGPVGAESAAAQPGGRALIVHVTGAVENPGVIELSEGARVIDVVARAGGATDDADLAAVNLAREVVDGEQIHLPRVGEEPPAPAPGAAGAASPGGAGGATAGAVVNINSASSAELETLPGVGPALAGRIIAWREQNGPFRSVDELLAVSGIGEKTLSGFRDQIGI